MENGLTTHLPQRTAPAAPALPHAPAAPSGPGPSAPGCGAQVSAAQLGTLTSTFAMTMAKWKQRSTGNRAENIQVYF